MRFCSKISFNAIKRIFLGVCAVKRIKTEYGLKKVTTTTPNPRFSSNQTGNSSGNDPSEHLWLGMFMG